MYLRNRGLSAMGGEPLTHVGHNGNNMHMSDVSHRP